MFSCHRGILLAANIAPHIRIHDPVVCFKCNDCEYSLQNFQLRETFSIFHVEKYFPRNNGIRMEYNVVIILLNTHRSYL